MTMKRMIGLVLVWSVSCFAGDLTTLDGTIYRDVKVIKVEVDGLTVTHAGGAGKIKFVTLPEDVRKQYNYDPAKAEAAAKVAVSAAKTGGDWQEMDQRMVFLTVQLSSVEASLSAINDAMDSLGMQQADHERAANAAAAANTTMDRNGGGPVSWRTFYGKTAEKFFYHPTDKRTSYHTLTVLRQTSASEDVAPAKGVPSRQGLPVASRPPQFDYIYRANADAEKRAQAEIARLGNNVEALLERRRQLEAEQSALWGKISFHAVAGRELLLKPLYFNDLKVDGPDSAESRQRLEALRAVMDYLRNGNRLAATAEQDVDADATRCYSQLQAGMVAARSEMEQRLRSQLALAGDLANKRRSLGKLTAVAKRMNEITANIVDAYRLALDNDRAGDHARKRTFRRQLQQSLMLCAEALLAGDECATDLAQEWKVEPALQTAAPVSTTVPASLVVSPRPVETPPMQTRGSASIPAADAPPEVQELLTPAFAALSPDERYNRVAAKIKELNTGLTGDIKYKKEGAEVTEIELPAMGLTTLWPLRAFTNLKVLKFSVPKQHSEVTDLSPLRGMQLVLLDCSRSNVADLSPLAGMRLRDLDCGSTQVSDLSPLRGMKLISLNCSGSKVQDLSPLAGMPLQTLGCGSRPLSDLSPLRGMKLSELNCDGSGVQELSPLVGMPLRSLCIHGTEVTDLAPLAGMPLTFLNCNRTPVADLTPLIRMPLVTLYLSRTSVTDLSPLKDMQSLRSVACDFKPERDSSILRSIKTLETINHVPKEKFWKGVDAGKSPQSGKDEGGNGDE